MCFFIVSKKSPARFWGLVSQNQNKKKKKLKEDLFIKMNIIIPIYQQFYYYPIDTILSSFPIKIDHISLCGSSTWLTFMK